MEAARIKKEVDGREREGNSSARNFARRCSYVFAQSSTTTDRHNNERRLETSIYLELARPWSLKMYEALRVKIEKIFKKTDGMGISRMDRFLLWNGMENGTLDENR